MSVVLYVCGGYYSHCHYWKRTLNKLNKIETG